MHNVRNITENLYWIGANDRRLALFENIHPIPEGVSYNSYMLLDEKTVVFDTVDWSVTRQYVENIEYLLNGRELDYLVVHHMEPDHCGSIEELALRYPNLKIISSEKGFMFMRQFGYKSINGHELIEVKEGDKQVIEELSETKFDIVIANINRNILLADMPSFVEAMKPQGYLILSGFYEEDVALLEEKAISLGLRKSQQRSNHRWVCLTFQPN